MYADLLYLAGTAVFFGAMLAYVRGCERWAGAPSRSASDGRRVPDRGTYRARRSWST